MSGGEKQRLAFARAVVSGHRLVIADEPTSQLDGESAEASLEAISQLVARGASVLVATHDDRVLERMSSVVVLRDGTVATISSGGDELAVIDRSGRIQLPPAVRDSFPDRRARLRWDPDTRRLTVDPP
jgi:ABC-type lipoprotein export system ATPase subunit